MSTAATGIQWTDRTWNPTRGCRRISPGCLNCYAERVAARFSAPGQPYEGLVTLGANGPKWNGRAVVVESALREPLSWRKPQRVFVDSMSDLFYEQFSDDDINRIFAVMGNAPQHTFQVLTKRTERLLRWSQDNGPFGTNVRAAAFKMGLSDSLCWPLRNVWIGASVEDQRHAFKRTDNLMRAAAAVRFLSYEPALGPVDFSLYGTVPKDVGGGYQAVCDRIHWIIVGGESGPGARPFNIEWARSALAQGAAASVPVFVKQLGARPFVGEQSFLHLRDKKGGDWNEWPSDLRVRQMPEVGGNG